MGVTIAYCTTPELPAFGAERVAAPIGDIRTSVSEAEFDRLQTPYFAADAQLMASNPHDFRLLVQSHGHEMPMVD